MENGVLNSWKEIAAYTGRGVRTVQRWECDLGFPVRRPRGSDRSAVIALKAEVDMWTRRTPLRNRTPHIKTHEVCANAHLTLARSQALHALSTSLMNNVQRAMAILETIDARRRAKSRPLTAPFAIAIKAKEEDALRCGITSGSLKA